jgi:23S rRNA (guanine2445-N2)-methyltransferase / 23S rRNA (guanine2069-N7)-methyltransferase
VLRDRFGGWKLALLTAEPRLAQATGLRAVRADRLYNGPIPCEVTHYVIGEDAPAEARASGEPAAVSRAADPPRAAATPAAPLPPVRPAPSGDDEADAPPPPSPYAVRKAARGAIARSDEEIASEEKETLVNRIQKNLRRLKTWAREEQVRCFRVYDADLPQYSVAVDFYEEKWAHVQEYAPPSLVDEDRAARRLRDVAEAVPAALGIPADSVFIKERRRQKGREQYERLDDSGVRHEVREGGLRFLVNFTDYLDTGLFLDHRVTRRMIADLAPGRAFLNLFCYTASASVYAAWGGALRTVSVDTSNTYLAWAQQNLELNGFTGERHKTVRADARDFLASDKGRYGLIFIDPPTFSNSKGDRENFSVQRDHVEMIRAAVERLERDGIVVFSNNFRKFKLDDQGLEGLEIDDVSKRTIPRDFTRNARIHRCWVITRRKADSRGRRR